LLAVMGRDEDGANAVEFALLLPILVVLLFGILFGGILLNQHLSVTQAAREGARFGATLAVVDSDEDGEPDPDWFADVRSRTLRGSTGAHTAGSDIICVWFVTAGGTVIEDTVGNVNPPCGSDPPGEPPTDDDGDRVVVFVQQPAVLELVLYSFDTTLSSRAVARHEGGIAEAP